MLEKFTAKLPTSLAKPDPRLLVSGIALISFLAAVVVVILLWRDQGSYKALYGTQEAYPIADVISALDAEAISYQLHPQTGQILVKDSQINRARMLLSAKGIKVAVPSGYELFDKEEPLGTSQFVQDVRLKRSLEGELARTLMTLKGIDQARVHLAVQENRSFIVSKKGPAKASITLQLSPGIKLTPEQVTAIIDLASNSVPNLAKGDISVVDQHGVLLSRGLNDNQNPVQSWQLTHDYQNQTTQNAELVLAPIVGAGNYRISISADIDFAQREETIQTYGDAPKVRNEVLRDESVLDQLALGVPGSLSNNPVNLPDTEDDAGNKAATSLRNESNRKYDYDQNITHVKHAPFQLKSQSISVVINQASAPEEGFTDASLQQLTQLVKTAVGFNEARGDQFALSVFPFNEPIDMSEPLPFWQTQVFSDLTKLAITALLALLLILLVLRPALKSLLQKPALSDARAEAQPNLPAFGAETPALATPTTLQETHSHGHLLGELNPLAEIKLPAPGSGLELQIEHLKMLATNDPERVSEVIKQWIGRNERKPS